MGRRIGQIAGIVAFAMMLSRLGRLLETGSPHANWQLILAAAAFLGAIGWWLLSQITNNLTVRLIIFGLGGVLLALRIVAADTLTAVFVPGPETLDAVGRELELAINTIRSGVPLVIPRPGLVAVLSLVMWSIGALYTWGSTNGPHAALFLPSLVMYLQFAVYDRRDVAIYWLMGAAVILSLGVVSLALERRDESGRARDAQGRPLARRTISVAVIMTMVLSVSAIALADGARDFVSEYGHLPWRSDTGGFGSGPGRGGSFDGLVDLKQRVINRSNEPMFTARVSDNLPASGQYWRMQTLDQYDNGEWSASRTTSHHFEPSQALASTDDIYQGTSYEVLATVRMDKLNSRGLAPTLGVPVDLPLHSDPSFRNPDEFNMFESAEIAIPTGFDQGDQYQVTSVLGDRTADLGVLATTEAGVLSPMFQIASDEGTFPHTAQQVSANAVAPPDLDRYTELPDGIPSAIGRLAREVTLGATTDFEKAWALEAWFRDEGEFTYSTQVSTGHDSLVLEDWLTDGDSQNYREGYCEQFAASMGVMLRVLGIPTRVVWGFTPGSSTPSSEPGYVEIVVRDTNAHAWVEVFLEPYGWFPFDPTPRSEFVSPSITIGFDPQELLSEIEDASALVTPEAQNDRTFGGDLLLGDPETTDFGSAGFSWWILTLALIPLSIVSIPLAKSIRRRRRLARIKDGDVTAAWDEIVDRLTDLGETVPSSQTPMELARSRNEAMVPLAASYSAAVYGGKTGQARETDLNDVEWWMNREYDTSQRFIARFNWRSLFSERR